MSVGDLQHCFLMLTQISKKVELDSQEYKALITAMALAINEIEARK